MEGLKDSKILSPTLADIYLQQGHIDKAIEIYDRLLKRDPENEFLKKRVTALKKEIKEINKKSGFKKLLTKKLW
ncbi:MAG: tetratricopeptide repeat protein [Syntrophorhabdaceae bacterium]|nr:tetratricopeptide repeat protein [Syntrophorhabdaceae bacterium]